MRSRAMQRRHAAARAMQHQRLQHRWRAALHRPDRRPSTAAACPGACPAAACQACTQTKGTDGAGTRSRQLQHHVAGRAQSEPRRASTASGKQPDCWRVVNARAPSPEARRGASHEALRRHAHRRHARPEARRRHARRRHAGPVTPGVKGWAQVVRDEKCSSQQAQLAVHESERTSISARTSRPHRCHPHRHPSAHLKPGGGMPGGCIMGGACMAGRGIIWPGPGAPTPGAGPASPAGAAPGAIMGRPRPAARPMPGPAAAAALAATRLSSAGGGPSTVRSTTSSPRRITSPSTRRTSRCGSSSEREAGREGVGRRAAQHQRGELQLVQATCQLLLLLATSAARYDVPSGQAAMMRQQQSAQRSGGNARPPPTGPSWAAACGTPRRRPAPGSCGGQTP